MVKSVHDLPEDMTDEQIAEEVKLHALNRTVKRYVKEARLKGDTLVDVKKVLRLAIHLANGDAAQASMIGAIGWTRHIQIVNFLVGYTQASLEDGVALCDIKAQVALACHQGERDFRKATRDSDPYATKELPKIDVDQYAPKRFAGSSGAALPKIDG
jgi:hypothetical protein